MCVQFRPLLLLHILLCPDQGFQVEEEASLRARWDQDSLRLLQESTKRCPQCSVPVERNGEKHSCWSFTGSALRTRYQPCAASCRWMYAHAVFSVSSRVVLAVSSSVEQRVYGRSLVWMTHTNTSRLHPASNQ